MSGFETLPRYMEENRYLIRAYSLHHPLFETLTRLREEISLSENPRKKLEKDPLSPSFPREDPRGWKSFNFTFS